MGNLWKSIKFNTVILSCTLGVFTFSSITPLNAVPQHVNLGLNDIAFSIRIEKLIKKVNRYREQLDSKKLTQVMFDIKTEVEGYTGKKN